MKIYWVVRWFIEDWIATIKVLKSRKSRETLRNSGVNTMEEGYKEMADENRKLAEQSLPIISETWPK